MKFHTFAKLLRTFALERVTRPIGERSKSLVLQHVSLLFHFLLRNLFSWWNGQESREIAISRYLASCSPVSLSSSPRFILPLSPSRSKLCVREPRERPVSLPLRSFRRYISNWRARPLISFYRRMGFETSGAVMRFKCKTG